MESKNIVLSKTVMIQILGLLSALLALPELQELLSKSAPEVLTYIISIQSVLTILLRIFSANKPLTFKPQQ
jgi:hypothetical protein